MGVPKFDDMFDAVLEALHNLGGSGSVQEIDNEVARILDMSDKDISIMMPNQASTKFNYRLAWTRNYLKNYGLIDNTKRGVWALTINGRDAKTVAKKEVVKQVRAQYSDSSPNADEQSSNLETELSWKEELLNILKSMKPDAFERFCKMFLREAGFIQVEVTGRSGDGGIDGHGVFKLVGILSFHVYFQCKRYQGSVSPSVVRDFRGAMVGRADKGIIITTGSFTRDAWAEAQRDGAPPLDLIDGDTLVEQIKDLGLGVSVKEKIVEDVTINTEWFEAF